MGQLCRLGAFGEALVPQRGKLADCGLPGIVHRRLESLFGLWSAHTGPFAEQSFNSFAGKRGLFLGSNSFTAKEKGETSTDSGRIGRRRKCFAHGRKPRRSKQFSRAHKETTTTIKASRLCQAATVIAVSDTSCTRRPSLHHIVQVRSTNRTSHNLDAYQVLLRPLTSSRHGNHIEVCPR